MPSGQPAGSWRYILVAFQTSCYFALLSKMFRFRKFLVLVLPMIVLFAWVGCITVCAEDTAGHGISIEITGESRPEIAPECQKICTIGTPFALLERHNVTAPAAGYPPVPVSGFSIPDLPGNIRAASIKALYYLALTVG